MSARSRGLSKEGTLPSNPKWLVIEATDGDSRRWPTNTTPNPDLEGNVNFMKLIPLDDGAAIKWRVAIGQALAEMLKYPDTESKSWVLKDWPKGYQFYDHHKGPMNGPRHDVYLVGSTNVARFRSPAEFIPHAYWLLTDENRDRTKCECKYCARKPQRVISDAMGLSQSQSSQAQFVELPRNQQRRRALPAREGRVFATVRRVSKPIKLPKGPKQHSNPDRERDLRSLLVPKTLGERRWAREGELVWVKLDHPIPVTERSVDPEEITFWPGIIEEVNFKADIIPRLTSHARTENGQHESTSPYTPKEEDADPWTIVHKFVYKIRLIIASKTVIYGSDHILPYQSHAPDGSLLNEVQSVVFDLGDDVDDPDKMVLPSDEQPGDRPEQALFKRFQAFDPFPGTKPYFLQVDDRRRYCETAAGAFASAIQIASRLSTYYTPCDAWEYKTQLPSDPADVWDTSQNGLTFAERQTLLQTSYGRPTLNSGGLTTQMRFQGLWWGPERIWMGDLVRLKLGRYQLAPDGTEVIKKTSGFGKHRSSLSNNDLPLSHSTLRPEVISGSLPYESTSQANGADVEMKIEDASEESDVGAASRSLFMRVDGLFVAQVATEDEMGISNECRMCGMLYELADDDWEPDGNEFGTLPRPVKPSMSNGTQSHQAHRISSGDTMATPLRTVMHSQIGTTVANAINGMTSSVTSVPVPTAAPPPSSSSSGLFAPNPELLSEPSLQPDVVMMNGTLVDHDVEPSTSGIVLPSQSISAMPTYTPFRSASGPDRPVDASTPKTETTTSSTSSLSGPLKSTEASYPIPPPPSLSKFRPILGEGHEVIMPLTMLAGRYYPGLLSNTLLQPRVRAALENPGAQESKAIRALEGLVPGAYNSVDASYFLPRRSAMLREAENVAWKELVSYWRRRTSQDKNAIVIDGD